MSCYDYSDNMMFPMPFFNYFSGTGVYQKDDYYGCILNDGTSILFEGDGFPKRWLSENFEQELKDGVAKYTNKYKENYEKINKTNKQIEKEKKDSNKKLLSKIKSKLSPDELEFLKNKLK